MITKRKKVNRKALKAEAEAIASSQGLIEWVMDQRNVSNKQLAAKLGISQAAVSQMLGLKPRNLTVKTLAKAMNALGDELRISSVLRDKYLAESAIRYIDRSTDKSEAPTRDFLVADNANDDYHDIGIDLKPCVSGRRSLPKNWRVYENCEDTRAA